MLTVKQIEAAKPEAKSYRLADSGGLCLFITTAGKKVWRLRYRFNGKAQTLVFGHYPAISLAEARAKQAEAKLKLSNGENPSIGKSKAQSIPAAENDFQSIYREWFDRKKKVWSDKYRIELERMFDQHILPYIGRCNIKEITPMMLLDVLKKFEDRGALERANKARRRCGEVFRFAVATGRANYNPAPDLASEMEVPEPKHYPFLQGAEISAFNAALAGYAGSLISKLATQLLQLTALRTIELRMSEWTFINFEARTWEIPKELMKSRKPHVVPMSDQVITILKQLQPVTGDGRFIFPGRNDKNKPISENTVLGVIRRVGFDGRASGHGFRHQMSTILNENGFNADLIELQLAHVDRNRIRGIYNHAQRLPERAEMMQWYGDWINGKVS